MRQTASSQIRSSLLDEAILRFDPQVFSHPVWIRFGKKEVSVSLSLIDDLFSAAKNLQEDDPSAACQILLICAVYQNDAGQHYQAFRMAQQALALAEHTGLTREMIWAMWGACAISIQRGDYEQAATNLVDLQAALSKLNEWVLADFVDVLRPALFQPIVIPEKHSESPPDDAVEDIVAFTFDWFQHWGFSSQSSEFELISGNPVNRSAGQSAWSQPFFSTPRWQGHWRSLMLAIRGELRLQWTHIDVHPIKERFSFLRYILSSLRLYASGRKLDAQATEDVPPIANIPRLPPAKESSSIAKTCSPTRKSTSRKLQRRQPSVQATTVVPVTVHMLGTFSLTIGELAVKLPASRGLSLLKYLLLHHKQNTPREVLMDTFWPDTEPETARNNLNVALHGLRKALRNVIFLPVIVFEDGTYGLEPNLQVWLDVEEFERYVKSGQRLESRNQLTDAVSEYETAISLYQGEFLEQNLYEEWTVLDREHLRMAFLEALDRLSQIYFSQERYAACITICQLMLARDRCREDTHCLLMRCYTHQGQYPLALRQYQSCVEALRTELGVAPERGSKELYERIRRRERV